MVTSSSCVLAQAYRTRCKRARLQSNSTEKESVRTFVAAISRNCRTLGVLRIEAALSNRFSGVRISFEEAILC